MAKQSWSVFVPCFNESKALPQVIDKIVQVLEVIASEYEIVLVDDGSADDSVSVIEDIQKKKRNISAVFHEINKGIGATQRRAYTTAKFENVMVIGSDGQFDPAELLPYGNIAPKTWLAFYRQELPSYTLFRKLLSSTNKYINNSWFGLDLKDVNWAMAFKTEALKSLDLELNSTLIKSEVCIKLTLLGYKPLEIPSNYHPRTYGISKGSSFKIIGQAFSDIRALYFSIRRFREKVSAN